MKKIFLTALVFAASCSEWPRTELEREVTTKDNYTFIDTATVTTTTDLDHVTNTVYITDTNEQDNTTNTQPILTQSVYDLSLKGGTTGTVTSANWTADNLTALEF